MTPHLTQDQITGIVIEGAPTAACQAHLSACVQCRQSLEQEIDLFGESLEAFNRSSLAWSAAQPHPVQRLPVLPRRTFPSLIAPALTFAALAVAFALSPVAPLQHVPVQVDRATEIAADNALLQQVNVALAANEPSPLDEYKIDEYKIDASSAAGTRTPVETSGR